MLGTVVGYRDVNFTPKDSPDPVIGKKLFLSIEPRSDENIYGCKVQEIWISDKLDRFLSIDFQVGCKYEFVYDYDGKFSHLVDVKSI